MALKTQEIKALKESSAEAALIKTKFGDNGLKIESKDGDFKMAVGGDLQIDGQINKNGHNIPQSAKLDDGAGLRRGRIHMQGTLYKDSISSMNMILCAAAALPLLVSRMPTLSIQASTQSALRLVNSESRLV